ncbi:MAG: hypothetical protein KC619_19170, partial [Myxococcales bacterium]|nr:hypothetical protein [Myxococcales bacterium]
MGTTETEPIRIEGVVRAGERVEVELRVGGQRVARGSRGERLEVEAAGGPVSLDVSALVLDAVPTSSHRGAWSELAARPEAALVADRSPAPHVAAELRIRRIAPGMAIAVEAIPTEHAFAESTVMRSPASRRPSAARATRMASPERPDGG